MSDLAAPPRPVTVEPDNTLDELAETLANLNATAKRLSRRGKAYYTDAAWRDWHQRIDVVLEQLEAKASGPAA